MPTAPATSLRVLVIDDDAIMRELLQALLAVEGYVVDAVESGETALRQLQSGSVADVLLCDRQLPGIHGAALTRELRTVAPQACILGMSGSQPDEHDRAATDAFLLKPFSLQQFADAIGASKRREQTSPQPRDGAPAPTAPDVLSEVTFSRLARSIPPAQMAELCRLTLADVDARLELLRVARDAGDEPAYKREAHALKGGCGMVGASEMAALAARAEAGSLNDTPTHADFIAAAERLRSMMTARSTLFL